jgi:hypothetical protein
MLFVALVSPVTVPVGYVVLLQKSVRGRARTGGIYSKA